MKEISKVEPPSHGIPDEPWIGNTLYKAGIRVYRTAQLGCYGNLPEGSFKAVQGGWLLPNVEEIIAEWEYNPKQMREVHEQWKNGTRKLPELI